MYSLVTAVLLKKGPNQAPKQVDISQVLVSSLFFDYISGYVVLKHPSLIGEQIVDLKVIKSAKVALPTADITFSTWLGAFPNTVFPVLVSEPEYSVGEVKYNDAWRSGYQSSAIHESAAEPNGYPISDKKDGYLYKQGVSLSDLKNYALTFVNGYLHVSSDYNQGLRVKDMLNTMRIGKNNHVGLLSFKDVGKIQQIPINPDMLFKQSEALSYFEETIVDLGIDLTNKSVLVSIGGYLNTYPGVMNVFNKALGLVRLDLSRIDLVSRVLRDKDQIDLSSLNLTTSAFNDSCLDVISLKNDATISAYLSLPQSFFIIVDTNHLLTLKEQYAAKYGTIGEFIYPELIKQPIIDSTGRLSHYWTVELEGNQMYVSVDPELPFKPLIATTNWRDLNLVNNAMDLNGEYDNSLGFLNIVGYKLA